MLNESHLFLVLSGFVAGLVYYANFYLSHLSYLAFPTLQVCICSLCFSIPTFTSHISVTWPFQHFRCVSAVFVFLYPPLPLTSQSPGLSNTSGVYLQSLFFYTHLYLSHLSHLAFPTLQVCICSLCFSIPTFTSHISVTWPFQHFRCVSAVFVFLYPPLPLTSQSPGLSNTSGVYLKSLFFCTRLYFSCLTYWSFQHFRCVSAICFSVPTFISHTSPAGLSNTSGMFCVGVLPNGFCTYN